MCTAYYIPVMYAVISDKFASKIKICLLPENCFKKNVFEAWINLNEIFFSFYILNVQFIFELFQKIQ